MATTDPADPTNPTDASESATATDAATTDVVLETRDLVKRFGELVATDEVNLAIERGEFRSVIGPNGAGKTTLFNLISGALTPTSGQVVFEGEDVSRLPPYERVKKGIGRSFQITNVFAGLSVRENVRVAAQSVFDDRISWRDRFLRGAGDFDDINERTDWTLDQVGLRERADERAGSLAYGDRRRLEIGLVLATDPQVVLLDEPTAGMSREETRATMHLIDDVLADRTLLLIEHDIDLVMNVSDRITVLDRGRELATGNPDEVAANDAVQAAYLGGER
ncbi:branched-chain amino acid transport system ATP-binding protein [Halogranum gelatinilyticum]|uniref:Probable branched-chain amino acid transport ATP-binding protein LivG n=1 Tax=Halogranum gelatinilyticum TaxID=660521 RepID=A0A1G9Z968_9EURY|nr:ABC transporter ATP-binding protein [Halogranum gelatinilyticum]SDN17992.1 branched-chain amino acid transport system ATP-binding protein [Halogranum gelatinilyticum]